MSDLEALAVRCEQATGPDRELDIQIALAIGWTSLERKNEGTVFGIKPDGNLGWMSEQYTASIDAAMTLALNENWLAFDPHFMDEERVIKFKGYAFYPDWTQWTPHGDWVGRSDGSALCATPALAICAAALRARTTPPAKEE